MSAIPMSPGELLRFVGELDDSPGKNTPRDRFRRILHEKVRSAAIVRDYVDECLRNSGLQYSRALQDLVNFLGERLGFQVEYGRYQGVQGQVGFDGLWKSPSGLNIVVECKTTDTYAIRTSTVINYVQQLIERRILPGWDQTMCLYVAGRVDMELRQIELAIAADRVHRMRVVSAESLLTLAELSEEADFPHADALSLLLPSARGSDQLISILARLHGKSRDGSNVLT